jgi:hypothetical protein
MCFRCVAKYASSEDQQRDSRIRYPDADRATLLRPLNFGDDHDADELLRQALCQLHPADGGSADDRQRI